MPYPSNALVAAGLMHEPTSGTPQVARSRHPDSTGALLHLLSLRPTAAHGKKVRYLNAPIVSTSDPGADFTQEPSENFEFRYLNACP